MNITTIDGKTVYMEPTTSDRAQREHHAARAKVEAKQAKQDAAARAAKEKRDRALPTQLDNMEHGLEGLRRIGQKMERQSDPKAGAVLQIVDEAVSTLHEYVDLTNQLADKRPDPLGAAVDKAGKELRKALPSCFSNQDEARRWALRSLPLTDARAAAVKLADHYSRLSRQRNKTAAAFWEILQRGAIKAGLGIDDAAIRHLVEVGTL